MTKNLIEQRTKKFGLKEGECESRREKKKQEIEN